MLKTPYSWASLVAQMVKDMPERQDTWVRSLGVGEISWRRKWQLIPVFLPGKSHEQRSLVDYHLGVAKSWTQLSMCAGDSDLFPDGEDSMCHGATKPVCHNYGACAPEPRN